MITNVDGIRVGHWTDVKGITGCTVVLLPEGTVGSCEWRGGSPGDREWVLLQPAQRVDRVHAIVLAGGSAFGLAAADGVMDFLEEKNVGWDAGGIVRVPIVPAAILFDLGIGDARARPRAGDGYEACATATGGEFECGSVGVGMGCTAGKMHGPEWQTKAGVGSVSLAEGDVVVAALVACNSVGDIVDEKGRIMAGSRAPAGTPPAIEVPPQNTVLGIVATNACLTKAEAHLVSRAGQDGIAVAVSPAHTRYDGDVVFALATGRVGAPVDVVTSMAHAVVAAAIRHGARSAAGAGGVPAGDG